jgi:hypothetical protein
MHTIPTDGPSLSLTSPHLWYVRSKARQRLLAYYFTNPMARLHLRDLAERLSIDPSNLSKELGRLEREGLFRSEVSGRQKYFQLNREYPLFEEVSGIVAKTIGAIPLVAQAFRKIEGVEEAFLYGSFAPRIDKKHAGLIMVFDRLRRTRNMALYDDTGFVIRQGIPLRRTNKTPRR